MLGTVYALEANRVATTVEMLLEHEHLTVQDAGVVQTASITSDGNGP